MAAQDDRDVRLHETTHLFSRKYLQDEYHTPVLTLGEYAFTKDDLREKLGNAHYKAARVLTKIFKRLHVTTVRDIEKIPMSDWASIHGVGEAACRILCDLLLWSDTSAKRYEKWVGDESTRVTWSTLAHRAVKKGRKRRHVV
jgi:hypothetical protein